MPLRVLDSQGEGEASNDRRGRALRRPPRSARVINLSLEFSSNVTASDIPELIEALRCRAAGAGCSWSRPAGNEAHSAIAYPATRADVVAVGATTEHGCLPTTPTDGSGLTLVAPGGGAGRQPSRRPQLPSRSAPPAADIFQVTFTGSLAAALRMPSGYEGTSMAATARLGDRRADHRQPAWSGATIARADHLAPTRHGREAWRWRRRKACTARAGGRRGGNGARRTRGRPALAEDRAAWPRCHIRGERRRGRARRVARGTSGALRSGRRRRGGSSAWPSRAS